MVNIPIENDDFPMENGDFPLVVRQVPRPGGCEPCAWLKKKIWLGYGWTSSGCEKKPLLGDDYCSFIGF